LIISLNFAQPNLARADNVIDTASQFIKQNLRQFIEQNKQFSRYEFNILPSKIRHQCNNTTLQLLNADFLSGYVRLKISCNDEQAWGAILKAQVSLYHKILITKTALKRGQNISAKDVLAKEIKFNAVNSLALADNADLNDLVLSKNVAAGNILRLNMVQTPFLIHKDEQVTVLAQHYNASIATQAIALNNGKLNQQIKLRNISSNKIIRAYVLKKGLAQINPQ